MSTPSIALIPSGYKSGKVYSVLPTNGDGDLDFSRVGDATRVNENGLIEEMGTGVPRLDYSGGGWPSLLLEPQSTNLVEYSEDISNAYWAKTNSGTGILPSVTSNYSISPDGTQNADRVVFDLNGGTANGDISQIAVSLGAVPSSDYTNSVYIKSNTANDYDLVLTNPNGTFVIKTINQEWQRFDTSTVGATNISIRIRLRGDESTSDYADVSIWGAQVEELTYATSYIPTNGTTETRSADSSSKSGLSSYINSSEGVFYLEVAALADDLTNRAITLSDGGSGNIVSLKFDNSSNQIEYDVQSNNVIQVGIDRVLTDTTDFNKIALKFKVNDFALWVNGVEIGSELSGETPIGLSEIIFNNNAGSFPFSGRLKDLRVYTTALTDQELTDLTS